jgi:crotonobetaine/carnitine-CoA ligase
MIPILMKQPPKENDNVNNVRFTLSAACPVDDWEKFEKRFGITIFEAYGSVDGGGKSIMNLGNAPVGSIGKPAPNTVYRLVDNEGNDVPEGTPGQLIFQSKGERKSIEYFKNEKASNDKLRNGWIYTGDLVKRDKKGYLYFVGRNAEFMRIKGENVSAYEVEHAIQKHPSVLEAAVYAVPSELAEDEIMTCVSIVDGHSLKEADLVEFLKENLAKFAVPRFIKIVKEFPKTETQRIIKKELEKKGIIAGTYDAQAKQYLAEAKTS